MEEILKVSVKRVKSAVACCALTTKAGTINESAKQNGLAHFTEHMFFKGTQKRNSTSINNRLEKLGGELNAYTTKEETVLHATLLKEDISKAIDLLFELAFTSVFPPDEIKKEREVIFDEIDSYKDSPSETIYEDFEQYLFKGDSLAMPILGTKRSLSKINRETFLEYISTYFTPNNMSFTIVANINPSKAIQLIEKSLKKFYKKPVRIILYEEGDKQESIRQNMTLKEFTAPFIIKDTKKKNHQAHCIIGTTAYSAYDKRKVALAVLTNILGGPASNSRLNMLLREKYAMVYSVEAVYTPFAETGIFSIYFGCDKNDIDKCIDLVKKEIEKLIEKELSDASLKAAKKQLMGQLSISQDNNEAQCLSAGKSLIVFGKLDNFESLRKRIDSITSAQIKDVANEILNWKRISILTY